MPSIAKQRSFGPGSTPIVLLTVIAVFTIGILWKDRTRSFFIQQNRAQVPSMNIPVAQKRLQTCQANLKIVKNERDEVNNFVKSCQDDVKTAEEEVRQAIASVATCRQEKEAAASQCEQSIQKAVSTVHVNDAIAEAKLSYAKIVLGADISMLKALLSAHKMSMASAWEAHLASQPPQGIVIVAGAQKYLLNAFVTLWAIRHYWNSTLPVTIMHLGFDWDSINTQTKLFFQEELGQPQVQFVDASRGLPWPPHHRPLFIPDSPSDAPGWKLKLFAAYAAPYQEILFLDADSTPVVRPESLFNLSEYTATGALFWPDTPCQTPLLFHDLVKMGLMSEDQLPDRETESGQWLLDRRRHREALEYALMLATHDEYTFYRAFGDKDLFRAGFSLSNTSSEYGLMATPIGFAWGPPDTSSKKKNARLMRGYIQFSSDSQPLFHHRAGWECKYVLERPEGRPLDAISAPLPCEWTMKNWPFEYPGERDDDVLQLMEGCGREAPLETFGDSVQSCAPHFDGSAGQRVPIFMIKGSAVEGVHNALESAWRRLQDAKIEKPILFENRSE